MENGFSLERSGFFTIYVEACFLTISFKCTFQKVSVKREGQLKVEFNRPTFQNISNKITSSETIWQRLKLVGFMGLADTNML